ncbi:branched-chain amino acid transport system permease protein [Haloarcula vallismortis]|uniref:Branched-chain amino acid ABC transporter permease n=2 Tax=Haloarcula vallismortis TaxID=28442 RepID=M0J7H0_HALVA|nr:branched-chain amino acid ABC transporter permease [Haloarcula vallismortis]EMA05067.1 branched-chain amino acid ABC transporter permease [Haloarcula vallismortis ATCC 29715]SDX12768.1 branched-chain amino acid transport system permease protein [Haloarcula vallismortis]
MAARDYYSRGQNIVYNRPVLVVFAVIGVFLVFDIFRQLGTGTITATDLVSYLWNGLVLGMSLGLAGVGLSMTYSILNFANFAHGDLITSGAFAGWATAFLIAGLGDFSVEALVLIGGPIAVGSNELGINVVNTPLALLAGLLVAAVLTAALSLLLDRIVFKPMRSADGVTLMIASVGVALFLRNFLTFSFLTDSRGLTGGNVPQFTLGGVTFGGHQITLVLVAALLMLATHVLLQYTKIGTAMRAMAANKDLAKVTGIPTERVVKLTWGIGGGLTGCAGFLIALQQGTLTVTMGWDLLLLVFAAVILGGVGSIYGAMVGGVILGIASRLALVWIPASFLLAAAFVLMIVMLLVRPSGLFSGRTTA